MSIKNFLQVWGLVPRDDVKSLPPAVVVLPQDSYDNYDAVRNFTNVEPLADGYWRDCINRIENMPYEDRHQAYFILLAAIDNNLGPAAPIRDEVEEAANRHAVS